jgi:dihydroorotate dehydrogenase electron transfer subunit
MDKIYKRKAAITCQEQLTQDIYSMWLEAKEIALSAKPGQFLSLYCNDGSRLLPRPISICEIDRTNGKLRLVYRVVGKGTKEFASYKEGSTIEVMGPLGNGFHLEDGKAILIGGGIGIPPMLELAKQLTCEKEIVLGYRNITFLENDFLPFGRVYISTEDGSSGIKGNVIDVLRNQGLTGNIIYACGPEVMLKSVKAYAMECGIKAQLSLEERMACGIGACLACVCRSKERDYHTNVKNKRICKDGPVFYAEEIEL